MSMEKIKLKLKNKNLRVAFGLGVPYTSCLVIPGAALVTPGLGSQLGLLWAPPRPAQLAAICRSLCSSCQVVPGRAEAVAEGPRASTPSGQLQTS